METKKSKQINKNAGKTLIFTDNKESVFKLSGLKDFLIISLNSQITNEIINNGIVDKENIKNLRDYLEKDFPTYEELHEYYKPVIYKKLKPGSLNIETQEIIENLMVDFLQLLAPAEYIKDIFRNICEMEKPEKIDFCINNKDLKFIFSNLT